MDWPKYDISENRKLTFVSLRIFILFWLENIITGNNVVSEINVMVYFQPGE